MKRQKGKFIFTIIALVCWSIVFGQPGEPWQLKVDASLLRKISDGQSTSCIIVLTQQADLRAASYLNTKAQKATYVYEELHRNAIETQPGLIQFLAQRNISFESLFIINALRTEGNEELIRALAQRSDVKQIIDDRIIGLAEPVEQWKSNSDTRVLIEWGIDMINADDVWAMGFRGQGVTIGGQDTGYEWAHPALKKQYRGYHEPTDTVDHNYNWHDAIHSINPLNADSINPCGLNSPVPCDDRGHGTHTMGTMIGLDSNNMIGVAPEAQWCACRNMERGWGSPFTYLECFQWFLAPTDLNNGNPDPHRAPHVINNSWACPLIEGCDSTNWEVMNMAVNILRLAGLVVVVSAGNSGGSGCGSVSAPAAMYEGSLSVGATAQNDSIAGFSSRGPVTVDGSNRLKPNVSAPGVGVRSASLGGDYSFASGTSMAGPHVAGVVALIISANPDLAGQVELIESIIEQTSVPKTTDQVCGDIEGSEVPNNTYGFGRVDALAAVEAALALIEVGTAMDHSPLTLRVFPNPVDDKLNIESWNTSGEVYIEIFDMQGRNLFTHQWKDHEDEVMTIDFSQQPGGIYFYRIRIGGDFHVGKVIRK